MAKSVITSGAEALAGIFTSVTAIAGVIGKNAAALDRASDASYGYADTYVRNADMRNMGSLKDTQLDEEIRDHERLEQRIKFMKKQKAFFTDFPEAKELLQPSSAKPKTTKK